MKSAFSNTRLRAAGTATVAILASLLLSGIAHAQKDPGVRGGNPGAGGAVTGLSPSQQQIFSVGNQLYTQITSVTGSITGTRKGLGPRYNGINCSGCHTQPAIGGSSPTLNPEIKAANYAHATNSLPSFVTPDGPALIARFIYLDDGVTPDGSVHDLFTITGRTDAKSCNITQPDFAGNLARNNVIFRIPTPTFGMGLVETIQDASIIANMNANAARKQGLGIGGHPNYTADGNTISRFGWKAQDPSSLTFTAEAHNTEMGVTNELLTVERDETPGCVLNGTPEDHTNFAGKSASQVQSATANIAMFMRFLDQPTPAPPTQSTQNGEKQFKAVGCVLCHTESFTTGPSSVPGLGRVVTKLYSDLLVHHMGPGLADNIVQGSAGGDEFRSAPLWGLGQRIFFMHDGRTTDLLQAIQDHFSTGNGKYPDSEANQVVNGFNGLSPQDQQDVLNFLRSL